MVREAVSAQFTKELGDTIRNFEWMRRLRKHSEYPSADHPAATALDAKQAAIYAQKAIDLATGLIDELSEY